VAAADAEINDDLVDSGLDFPIDADRAVGFRLRARRIRRGLLPQHPR